MSIDKTLKKRGALARTRNVLTRNEQIMRLLETEKFNPEEDSPFGLPTVRVRKIVARKAKKKVEKEEKKKGKKKK